MTFTTFSGNKVKIEATEEAAKKSFKELFPELKIKE